MSSYFTCPVCGEEVKEGAASCPGCGACEKTGLNGEGLENEFTYDGLGLPDDDFDYDAFVKNEFGEKAGRSKKEVVFVVAVLLLVLALVLAYIR